MPHPPSHYPVGQPFIELQTVDSTNNYALGLIHDGLADPGTAVFAHEQTAGKGQRGRSWVSGRGENLAVSLLIRPGLPIREQFRLSACIAAAAHQLIRQEAGTDTRIKWPNDLYWQDRKIGGILIENIVRSHPGEPTWSWAVAGIGINLISLAFPDSLPNPVSLRQITGREYDPKEMALKLCTLAGQWYERLHYEGFGPVHAYYQQQLYKKGEAVRFRQGARSFVATVSGVSETGRLQLEHGLPGEYDFGELEWLING